MNQEERKRNDENMMPRWDETGGEVHWQASIIPAEVICAIDADILFLWHCMDEYLVWSSNIRAECRSFMVEATFNLGRLLQGISSEALIEAFQASLALQRFVLSEKESDRDWAKVSLLKVRRLLYLDHLFPEDKILFEDHTERNIGVPNEIHSGEGSERKNA